MIGSHRDQAHFDRAKWRKRVLLPSWIVQIPILLALMSIFAYRLSNTIRNFKDEEAKGEVPMVEVVWECVNIAFSGISFIINLIQIAKFIAEALTPFGMVFGNCISLTLSLAILALDVVIYVQHADKNYARIGLVLDCALLFFTTVPTIYGVVVYRRLAAFDEYHHPYNAKHFGFTTKEVDTSYDPARMSLNVDPEALYDPSVPADGGRPRRPSFTFKRTSSGGAATSPSHSVSPHPRPEMERRNSYDHKRDTQFDEYVATRRASLEGSEKGADSTPALPTRSRGNSLTKPASWELNLGDSLQTPTGTVMRGHSLVSVPEAREEDDHHGVSKKHLASSSSSEDRRGLLGSRRVSDQSMTSYSSRGSSSRFEPVRGQMEEVELDNKRRRRDS